MTDLFIRAVELMLLGLGFVFVFLTILVFATDLMSKAVTKFVPEPALIPKAPAPKASSAPAPVQVDAQLLSVISAAVKEYRSRHKK